MTQAETDLANLRATIRKLEARQVQSYGTGQYQATLQDLEKLYRREAQLERRVARERGRHRAQADFDR